MYPFSTACSVAILWRRMRRALRPRSTFFGTLLLIGASDIGAHAQTLSTVPFVGCKSDGQAFLLEAPAGQPKQVTLTAEFANQLAYYKAEHGPGILGPRGWTCFGVYGSNADTLYVTPTPLNPETVMSGSWKGVVGPGIQVSDTYTDTSGRLDAAQIAARIFPAEKAFVQRVMKEGLSSGIDFTFAPYPGDQLHYLSDHIVEYQTPRQTEGLGTSGNLRANSDPIRGVVVFDRDGQSLLELAVRLPSSWEWLAPTITEQMLREIRDKQAATRERATADLAQQQQAKTLKEARFVELCDAARRCRAYGKTMTDCAMAGNISACVRIKVGSKYPRIPCREDASGEVAYPPPDMPGRLECLGEDARTALGP